MNIIKEIMMSKNILVGDSFRIQNLLLNVNRGILESEQHQDFLLVKAGKDTKTTVQTHYKIPNSKLA